MRLSPPVLKKSLPANEQKVYDAIARRFIAAFYPDCIVANTTVRGEVDGVKFKATGKEILEPGWRVLFPKKSKSKSSATPTDEEKATEKETILPTFVKGESGPHTPSLVEKVTQPPKSYTEASLLRAMETAGKKVDDDELRELMKANGIGRPSTRANIIETLFKRRYIQRKKKLIVPTETGIQLIGIIQNKLLKSAELTGQWEKQLREIEAGEYSAAQFISEMKTMVDQLVVEVRMAKNVSRLSSSQTTTPKKVAPKTRKKTTKAPGSDPLIGLICPKCRKGKLLKGRTAYGCSRWQEDCSFRLPFVFMQKKISGRQLARLMKYGSTILLKGFRDGENKVDGKVHFNAEFSLELQRKATPASTKKKQAPQKVPDSLTCPKCGLGKVLKGKTAYGCSHWQTGCTFRFPFGEVRRRAGGRPLTRALVWEMLQQGLD